LDGFVYGNTMKKLIFITILLSASLATATEAFVQANIGGSNNISGARPLTVTATGSFTNPTTSGNFLVCVSWAVETVSGLDAGTVGLNIPTATGLTWQDGGGLPWASGGSGNRNTFGVSRIFYVPNAPAFSGTVSASATDPSSGVSAITSFKLEFVLLEFSGVSGTLETHGDWQLNVPGGSVVDITANTTHNGDLIIVCFTGDGGSNLPAGSGFTLGPSATVATVGQVQYMLNAPIANTHVSFGGSAPIAFAARGDAFVASSPPAGGVQRHHGTVY
jgi:hypothetical protein